MKILFTKISESRKKEFEIITSIVEDNNQLYVYKQGVYDSKHVLNMENNALLLSKYLPDYIDEHFADNGVFKTKFSVGKPLSELIVEGQQEKAIAIFKKILSLVPSKKFKEFDKVDNKFYDIDFDNEEESFVVSNYDLTFFNIIYNNDNSIKIIDYEWVYTYPIPKKAIIYRAFKQLKEQYPTLDFDVEKYLKEFGINNTDKYDLLEQQFQEYVVSDFHYRDSYKRNEIYFDSSVDYSALHEEADTAKRERNEINEKAMQLEHEKSLLEGHLANRDERIHGLEDTVINQEHEIAGQKNELRELKEEIIPGLEHKIEVDTQHISSLEEEVEDKNTKISNLEEKSRNDDAHISSLEEKSRNDEAQISSLSNDLNSKSNDLDNLLENYRHLDDEKEMYKIKSENYENSTMFKLMKPYWKFRDWLFPVNSKRRLFLKVVKTAIRHPIWTLKHLNGRNIRKFNKYLKSEGAERCLERIEVYESKNPSYENFDIELFNMKARDEYPELVFPYSKTPVVTIVIPVYNQFAYTYGCLESILKNTQDVAYQVIIADDCSTDETSHMEDYVKNVLVLHNKENLKFLLNCNNAAKYADGQYIFFLNNDTNVQEGWLSSLVETIESNINIGMVGSKLVYPDGRLQEAGGILWKDGSAWNFGNKSDPTSSEYNYRKPVDYISGAAIMIKKKLWNKIGGFDERYAPAYCEDSDLAFEVRKNGFEVIYDPFSVVVHYEGVSNGTDTSSGLKKYQVENSKKLYKKWKDVFALHPDNAEDVFIARERAYNTKMILVIDHYVPEYDKDAGSRTVFDYLRIFVDLGYRVKFIGENFYKSEPYVYTLEKLGIEVLYGPYYANNYKTWLKNNGGYFDYVFMNRPHITAKFIDTVIECCPKAKLIYYGHDLHFLRLQREYEISGDNNALAESNDWKKTEFDIYKKVDLIYYPSIIEQETLKQIDSSLNVKVLQPYVYKSVNGNYNPSRRKNLLFVGGFRHGANFDGVNWFIKEVFPGILEKDKDIVLNIAGSYPPQELLKLESDNIHILGFVTDRELDMLYKTSKMVVVPLRFGAGIKGKVIEAMRNGVPVMTTHIGAEGIDENALAVDDNFEGLLSLYCNNKKLEELSKLEVEYIKNNYSYDSAVNHITEDFEELLK